MWEWWTWVGRFSQDRLLKNKYFRTLLNTLNTPHAAIFYYVFSLIIIDTRNNKMQHHFWNRYSTVLDDSEYMDLILRPLPLKRSKVSVLFTAPPSINFMCWPLALSIMYYYKYKKGWYNSIYIATIILIVIICIYL